ncbi:MAG: MBL fold metallo-hydrolase [Bacteroidales bacterium]|nr:MBL fold metallo-hydrolase [Bacteroidales bacterium]
MSGTRLTFLGTGTSQGVPMIGCDCPVCRSLDPRDKRLRASVLVEYGGLTLLVDCGPDFRQQMLRADVRHIDAILLTHNHKDHTGGLDDTRSFNLLESKPVNIWCEPYVARSLQKEYSYAFAEPRYPGSPEWHLHLIEDTAQPLRIGSNAAEETLVWESGYGYRHEENAASSPLPEPVEVIPIRGWHHKSKELPVLGYRFGDIAYLTDINLLEDSEFEKLKGLKAVTIGCVKRGPHHAHPSLPEALAFFERVGAEHSYITHISHLLPCHADFDRELPEGVHPAWDGLVIED